MGFWKQSCMATGVCIINSLLCSIDVLVILVIVPVLTCWSFSAVWASGGQIQAAHGAGDVRGVEPCGLERVRRLRGRRRRQPMGSVRGVMWRGSEGRRGEGFAPPAAVLAPGTDWDQGDPLASTITWSDDLHCPVRLQCVQDDICVEVCVCVCVFGVDLCVLV